jgi:signal transduction histidine kinase
MKEKKSKSGILPPAPVPSVNGVNKEMLNTKSVLHMLTTLTEELEAANKELLFQNEEKEKRAKELIIANIELVHQNLEKEKRAAELVIANKELAFQNEEKEKRAAELVIANKELLFQNKEKEKRAEELIIANVELVHQNLEKEKRAAELVVANTELAFQNGEKEKRAAELVIANKELAFQNATKEKLAEELMIANIELVHQNKIKQQSAAELVIANTELAFQNEEKEKRAGELLFANNELRVFTYISSHDLQEPLRKIQVFAALMIEKEAAALSESGKDYLHRTQAAAQQMQFLIHALQEYSHSDLGNQTFSVTSIDKILEEVKKEMYAVIFEKKAVIEAGNLGEALINPLQFHMMLSHLLSNALKFSKKGGVCQIKIHASIKSGDLLQKENPGLVNSKLPAEKNYYHLHFSDNGIGFESKYKDKIFEVFQRLNAKNVYPGSGIGLPIVKKIIENHNGFITATGELGKTACFDIYIPVH